MGCSNSMNSEIFLIVNLNTPVFKQSEIVMSVKRKTQIGDLCKEILISQLSAEYQNKNISCKITCKNKDYTINDCVSIHELHLVDRETIKVEAIEFEQKDTEIILKVFSMDPREIVINANNKYLVRDLLCANSHFRFIKGDIEMDNDEKIENYKILGGSKVIVIINDYPCDEIQPWRIKKSGLVLEAVCMNIECVANKQRICINLGIGEFDLYLETSEENERECVCCREKLGKVSRIGVCHCQYRYNHAIEDGSLNEESGKTIDYIEIPFTRGNDSVILKTIKYD